MPVGFFTNPETTTKTEFPLLPQCGLCKLNLKCKSPKMEVDGKGKRKILVLGEAAGKTEDVQNKPFVGESGQLLKDSLKKIGIDFRNDCWIYNSVICRPSHPDGNNRNPSDKEISYCRPNTIKLIKDLQPENIIALGGAAVQSLIPWLWKDDVKTIGRWIGWQIPSQKINSWVCPAWHPSFILRTDYGDSRKENDVRKLIWMGHLKAAFEKEGRPWKKIPDYGKRIKVLYNQDEIESKIKAFTRIDYPIAWDYETDRLKPDCNEATIVSCSLSDGKEAFAYPWKGKAVGTTKEFLRSITPKIASNMKFEERWSKRKLGFVVNNWFLDTMQAAHVLDNRSEICSIKFQAFVLLGFGPYDEEIHPLLKSNNSNQPNKIKEIPFDKLLFYNGMDSLLEWIVGKIQARKLGIQFGGSDV